MTTLISRPATRKSGKTGHVQIIGLNKVFGNTTRALDDFHCEFHPGEMVVLLGPSGCGKTTALRVITGLEHADSGRVILDGEDITLRSPAKRNMAMVFQQYSLFPHLTAIENVEFGLRVRGMKADERRNAAKLALEMVGLADQAGKYTSQMSGGQQQRVALARAIVVRPSLLALDEPLSALDAKVRVALRDQIRHIQLESGITTLFVTHDQEEALAVADRIGVMNAGKLVQIGSPQEIYNAPVNEFVASFIGVTNRLPSYVNNGYAQVFSSEVKLLPSSTVNSGLGVALVRPETISLTKISDDAAALYDGNNLGRVAGISFLGAQVRVEVKVDRLELLAQLSPAEAEELRLGDYVLVKLRDNAVLVIEEQA